MVSIRPATLLQVAEDHKGKIVGYVLAKMEDEDDDSKKHGHVTSLSVLRTHRKCGLATALMNSSHKRMTEAYDANFSALHVRETNHAAFHLYSRTLQYAIHEVEKGYYADGEDAYDMRKNFKTKSELKEMAESPTDNPNDISDMPALMPPTDPPPPPPPETGGGAAADTAKK